MAASGEYFAAYITAKFFRAVIEFPSSGDPEEPWEEPWEDPEPDPEE